MADEQVVMLTRADLAAVSRKLEEFSRTLSAGERAALADLLQQAMMVAGGDNEVSGYDLGAIPLPDGDIMTAFGVA